MYGLGKGIPEDRIKAFELCKSAVAQKYPRAYYILGRQYRLALWGDRDVRKAIGLLKKAASLGCLQARVDLALIYIYGEDDIKDVNLGLKYAFQAARHGNADAQAMVGALYYEGKFLPKDYSKALQWLNKSKEQHCVVAYAFLANVYMHDPKMSDKFKIGLDYAEMAADGGDAMSNEVLGTLYLMGLSDKGVYVKPDFRKSLFYYRRAAEIDSKYESELELAIKQMKEKGASDYDLMTDEERAAVDKQNKAEKEKAERIEKERQKREAEASANAAKVAMLESKKAEELRIAAEKKLELEKLEQKKREEAAREEAERIEASKRICKACHGTGRHQSREICGVCGGTRLVEKTHQCMSCKGEGERTTKVQCPGCNGKGKVRRDCSSCGGKGSTRCSYCNGAGGSMQHTYLPGIQGRNRSLRKTRVNCSECGGTGKVRCWSCNGGELEDCSRCDGSGVVTRDGSCTVCKGQGEVTVSEKCSACADGFAYRTSPCTHCNGEGRALLSPHEESDIFDGIAIRLPVKASYLPFVFRNARKIPRGWRVEFYDPKRRDDFGRQGKAYSVVEGESIGMSGWKFLNVNKSVARSKIQGSDLVKSVEIVDSVTIQREKDGYKVEVPMSSGDVMKFTPFDLHASLELCDTGMRKSVVEIKEGSKFTLDGREFVVEKLSEELVRIKELKSGRVKDVIAVEH